MVPAAMQATSNPGKSVVLGSTRDAANVMVVRRDAGDTQQRSRSSGREIEPTPRIPPPDFRPAHTRAVASLDGSRCIVIIDTGADVSLVSARMFRPGIKYLPWSERDGRITGVAQQLLAVGFRRETYVPSGRLRQHGQSTSSSSSNRKRRGAYARGAGREVAAAAVETITLWREECDFQKSFFA